MANSPPVLKANQPSFSLLAGSSVPASSFITATDADNDPLTFYLYDNTPAANSGHYTLNGVAVANGTPLTATQLSQTQFVTGAKGVADDIVVVAFDGTAYSNLLEYHVTGINNSPVLTVSPTTTVLLAGQQLLASGLFSATDADGDSLTYTLFDATSAPTSGYWLVNGTTVPANTSYAITAAQLAQTYFVAGAAGTLDNLSVAVSDGTTTSNVSLSVRADTPPTVMIVPPGGTQVTLTAQQIPVVNLFFATDPDPDALTFYVYDNTPAGNSGHLVFNGQTLSASTTYTFTQAQLNQLSFVAGAQGVSDDLIVVVSDGHTTSSVAEVHVNADSVPVVTPAAATIRAVPGATLATSSLFVATDADHDTLTYTMTDTVTGAAGHFVVNGVGFATPYNLTAAQFAQTTYLVGSAGSTDTMTVLVGDGHTASAPVQVKIVADNAPQLTPLSSLFSAIPGQSFTAASLFSGNDLDSDPLTYTIYDNTPAANSGHFLVNGTVVPASTPYTVTAAQLAQTTFVAGAAGTNDDVLVSASDGLIVSPLIEFHVKVDNPPVMTLVSSNVSAIAGQVFTPAQLFSATDADNDPLTYYLLDNTPAANSGFFTYNGFTVAASATFPVSSLALVGFQAGAAGTSDDLFVSAYDGKAYSNLAEFHVTVDNPPVLTATAATVLATAGFSFDASTLFHATDADNDVLTYTLYDNTPAAGSGHFVVNGTVVPSGPGYTITAAQLAQTTFVAGAGGANDDVLVSANDGKTYSNLIEFHVKVDNAPTLAAVANFSLLAGQSVTAPNLFTGSDLDGDPLTYFLYDNTSAANSGHFLVNGVVVPAGTSYSITSAQLAQTTFVAGAPGVSDDVLVVASDGRATSSLAEFHVIALDNPPVLAAASASVTVGAGASIAASSLFHSSDADGDALTYYLYDNTSTASSGHFVVNGAVVPASTPYLITAAQLAQTTFVAGVAGSNDDLIVSASDGHLSSGNIEFHVKADTPPVLTAVAPSFSGAAGMFTGASNLFSATDADGDALTYYLYDNTPAANSGHFQVNGIAVPAGTATPVTAAQLANTFFVAGATGTTDDLLVSAYDGTAFSNTVEFNFNVPNHAPVMTVPNPSVNAGAAGVAIVASSLFHATDADGDALTYYLYDNTTAASSGHFTVAGNALPAGTTNVVTAAQLANTAFVSGAAGSNDDLLVSAYDGHAFSNLAEFHVLV